MLENFIARLPSQIDFNAYTLVFAGFSGGADSTALLLILRELQKAYPFKLTAVHFEHGIRGQESIEDAKWCRDFCFRFGISYLEIPLEVLIAKLPNQGVEEAARHLRLQKWFELASAENSCVALGHHSGDKVENLFIRLLRGSNSSGLTSLRYFSKINGVNFLRPLLDFSKPQIENLLRSLDINNWRIDSTNLKTAQRRNFIRNELLPIIQENIPNALASLNSAYSAIQCDAEFVEECAAKEIKNNSIGKQLSVKYINSLHNALKTRILRYWLTNELGYEFIPSKYLLERVNHELCNNHPERKLIPINKNTFISIRNDSMTLSINNTNLNITPDIFWEWQVDSQLDMGNYSLTAKVDSIKDVLQLPTNKASVYFDAELLPEKLIVRYKQDGDKFTPFGYDKEIKVSKTLQNEKIAERKKILLLSDNEGKIYWVIGIKRSDLARISNKTKQIVCFSIENKVD